MYCPNCGKDNSGNKFCSNCGTLLNNSNSNIETTKANDYKNISLVLGIVCLIMSFSVNVICLIPGIISIVFALKYKKESGKFGVGFGLSLGGMIFSIVIFLLVFFFFFIFSYNVKNRIEESYDYNYGVSEFYKISNIK